MTDDEFVALPRVMVDIESFGGEYGRGSIVQIGAVAFDCTSTKIVVPEPIGVTAIDASTESAGTQPELYDRLPSFIVNITIASNMKHGLPMTGKTIAWWMGHGKDHPGEAARAWLFDPPPIPLDEALARLRVFTASAQEIWAYPSTYDLVYLAAAYEAIGSQVPWKSQHMRDARTVRFILDDEENRLVRYGEHHHALWDACVQTTFLRRALVKLRGRRS